MNHSVVEISFISPTVSERRWRAPRHRLGYHLSHSVPIITTPTPAPPTIPAPAPTLLLRVRIPGQRTDDGTAECPDPGA